MSTATLTQWAATSSVILIISGLIFLTKKHRPFLLSTLSGALLALAFPPFDLEFLAFIALIPFFFAIKEQKPKQSFFIGLLGGIAFYSIMGYWLIESLNAFSASLVVFPIVMLLLALTFGITAALLAFLRKYEIIVIAPVVWVAVEYTKTLTNFSFPGGILGYSQYLNINLIQIASIFGVLSVSFLIVLVNAFLFVLAEELLRNHAGLKNKKNKRKGISLKLKVALLLILIVFSSVILFGMQRNIKNDKSIKIALVQTSFLGPNSLNKTKVNEFFEKAQQSDADLIIMPESSFISVKELPKNPKINLFAGLTTKEHNSAVLIKNNETAIYHKIRTTPFYETIPLNKMLPNSLKRFIKEKTSAKRDVIPGENLTAFETGNLSFFTIICSEEMYGSLVAENARSNPDFIIAISNDGFSSSMAEHYQHSSMLVFRAVETRMSAVRVANTGPSFMLNQYGEMEKVFEPFEEGIAVKTLNFRTPETSPYARYGDFFALACVAFLAILFLINACRKINKKP